MSNHMILRYGKRFVRVAVLLALVPGGCASMSNTDKGVVGGGAVGAGTGAVVGHALGHTGAGAVIGGVVGAVTGGVIGNHMDENERQAAERAAQARWLSQGDVIQMAQQHVSDGVIIGEIRSTGSIYHLTADDIINLKANGVSDVVIRVMQDSAYRHPRRVYVTEPVYVEPAPTVGVGIGYSGRLR